MDSVNPSDTELAIPAMLPIALDPYSHPLHIKTVSHLYGVTTAALDNARVMVLGCGAGTTMLPFCHAWPKATVIGIDIDNDAIEQGKQQGAALPPNLELHSLSLDELINCDPGKLDYIIIAGLYAFLSNDTRAELLKFCQRYLSDAGVIAIKWPCYPGSRSNETLRDAMLFHSATASSVAEQISSARAMIDLLALSPLQQAVLQPCLQESEASSDAVIQLNYLSDNKNASYLIDFNSMISEQGLAYLGDIQPWSEIPAHYGQEVASLVQTVCPDGNKLISQQYLDFIINRRERFSLLVAQDKQEKILPLPDKSALKTVSWAGQFTRVFNQDKKVANIHVISDGNTLSTEDTTTLQLFDALGDAWPLSLSFKQLASLAAPLSGESEEHEEKLVNILYSFFLTGMKLVSFCSGPSPYQYKQPATIGPLPGLQAIVRSENYQNRVYNFWQQNITLEPDEINLIAGEVLTVSDENYLTMLGLKRKGLITGNLQAWQDFSRQMIVMARSENVSAYVSWLLLFSFHLVEKDRHKHAGKVVLNTIRKKNERALWPEVDRKITNKVNQLFSAGRANEALEFLTSLTAKNADNPHMWHELTKLQIKMSLNKAALNSIKHVFPAHKDNITLFHNYFTLLINAGYVGSAEKIGRYCLYLDNSSTFLLSNMGKLLSDRDDKDQSELFCRRTLDLMPNNTLALATLGNILKEKLKPNEAIAYLRKAYQSSLDNFNYFTNYLFSLTHSPDINAEELFIEHQRFGRVANRWVRQQSVVLVHDNLRDSERTLRIGVVSGDLGRHPVTNFFRPIWDAVNREKFHFYVYQTSHFNDEVTEELKGEAFCWHSVVGMGHVEIARLIHQDKIDILLDLSGHTDYNRLVSFAFKPAPVSISLIGYPGTTGLREMDYYLAPAGIMPFADRLEKQFTEKLIYFPWGNAFSPFSQLPDIQPLPRLKNGYFTYGSFNRPSKINDRVIKHWADILRLTPDARMLIGAMTSDSVIDDIRRQFMALGIDAQRLIFRKKAFLKEYMALHNEVDLLLDTFPYTGGTTTSYGLQMGLPTLTLTGETLVTFQGAMLLSQLGLDEFIVQSSEAYINKAVDFAANYALLKELRGTLRQRLAADTQRQFSDADYFEKMLRTVWTYYCEGKAVDHIVIEK